jgi:hypothetical protein
MGGEAIDLLGPIGFWGGFWLSVDEQGFRVCLFLVPALGVVGLVHFPGGWALVFGMGFLACLLVGVECFSYLVFRCWCFRFPWCCLGAVFSYFNFDLRFFL